MATLVKLIIKSPASQAQLLLEIDANATLAEVQQELSKRYEGHPLPEHQTLIFAGKVLKDHSVAVRTLIEKHVPFEGPHSFHLVIKKEHQQQPHSAAADVGTREAGSTPVAAEPPTASTSREDLPPPPAAGSAEPAPAAASTGAPGAQAAGAYYSPAQSQFSTMYLAAYQAAYAAAIASTASSAQATNTAFPSAPVFPMCYMPVMLMPQAYYPYLQTTMPLQQQLQPQQQQQQHGLRRALRRERLSMLVQAGLMNGQEIRIEGFPQDAVGPVALALANLRQLRGGQGAGGQAGQGLQLGGIQVINLPRPRRLRINVRLSIRTMLQVLVFAMVLYQHFTLVRFVALLFGGLFLYLATAWEPLRRVIEAALQQPPPPPQPLRPAAAAAVPAAGRDAAPLDEGQQQEPVGNAEAAAAEAPHAVQPQHRRGVLNEILVIILGFVTSLLPAWNYNPEDAAAFAAGQAIAAREDREVQPQAGLAAANGEEGAAGNPAAGAANAEPAGAAA